MLWEQRGRQEEMWGGNSRPGLKSDGTRIGCPASAGKTAGDRAYAKIILCEQSGPPSGAPPRWY